MTLSALLLAGFITLPATAIGVEVESAMIIGEPERRANPSAQQPAPRPGGRIQRVVQVMGTTLRVELEAPTRCQALAASELAIAAVERLEASLSTWRPDSELSLVGQSPVGAWIQLTPEVGAILQRALHWESETAGAFDPTIASLVRAWDLRGAGRVPTAPELKLALAACGVDHIQTELPHRIARSDEHVGISEGGFGKGAALDAALAALQGRGVRSATLDLGGQVLFLTEDVRANETAPLAIAHPDQRDLPVALLRVAKGSCATSGNSERGLVVRGQRVGHLLDPRTGQPAPDFGSVTVWCASALDADCLSTALYVLGPDAGLKFAERRTGIEAVFAERTETGLRIRATSGLRPYLTTIDSELTIEWSSPLLLPSTYSK